MSTSGASPVHSPSEVRDFEFIDTPAHLAEWIAASEAHLAATGENRCCLDTEADSLHHYHEKLCLLQVACAGRFALVDPLAVPDVTPLLGLLDRHELWFHGADYDLTMLRRTYNWAPRLIRDTQIAARLTGSRPMLDRTQVDEFAGRYAYFSSATPVAMAKVFGAYGCEYAMHLDMNALEHTYLAIYLPDSNGEQFPHHLITGMAVLDQRLKGNIPRFVGYPDNRDFFYLTTKDGR